MITRIGIPLFASEVSPRFCFAKDLLVVESEQGRERCRFVAPLGDPWLPARVATLASLGIGILLCGGFNRAFRPAAERLGIRIVTGIAGDAEKALAAFLRDQCIVKPKTRGRCRRGRALAAPVDR